MAIRVVTIVAPTASMDPALRRRVMSSIPKRDTRPELVLRRALMARGIRGYRCHLRSLPGTPDVAFTRWRVAIFVDGVWWHGHPDHLPRGKRGPYWDQKIAKNIERDVRTNAMLAEFGWIVVRLWDLDIIRMPDEAVDRVAAALSRAGRQSLVERQPEL